MSSRSILLVEDSAIARKMFRVTLEVAGYRVVEADCATAALAVAASEMPDLVLQDLVLPDMQAFELTERLREIVGDAVPFIALSGFQSLIDQAKALASTFSATLVKPVEPAELIRAIEEIVGPASSAEHVVRLGKRVLVVDDDQVQRKLTALHLEGEGYDVVTAAGGDVALTLARSSRPDIVLSDVLMPALDGFQLCLAIRADPALDGVRVVLVSAHYSEGRDQDLAQTVGADALVLRTPSFAEVLRAMEGALTSLQPARFPDATGQFRLAHVARLTEQLDRQRKLNAELTRRCAIQAAQLTTLCGVADALAMRSDPGPVLTDLLHASLESGGISKGIAYELSDGPTLIARHAVGFDGRTPPPLHELLSEEVQALLLRGQPATVPAPAALGVGRAIVLPLLVRPQSGAERCVGALLLGAEAPDITEHSLFAFGRAVSAYVGQALALASAFDEVNGAARENARLYRDTLSASVLKDEFLATVSHELRAPLSAIVGWTAMARDQIADKDLVLRGLDVIERNALSQATIVEDILDVSRIVSGRLSLVTKAIDGAVVVRRAVELVATAALAKEVSLEVSIAPRAAYGLMGDAQRLQQVVGNLLGNAVKFTPRGGRVTVGLGRTGDRVTLRVSDTGVGITAEFLPFLFEAFRQADGSITRREGGLGLGLSIVRHLVELHGGTIAVESAGEGRGATFVVELPAFAGPLDAVDGVAEQARSASSAERWIPASEGAPVRLDGVKVLLVDDDIDGREILGMVLEAAGAEVRTCASAQEGMDALEEFAPRVLVSDLGMPDEDGYAFLARVRARSTVPAIALTGYASQADIARVAAAGFQLHLGKPVPPTQLIDAVARLSG